MTAPADRLSASLADHYRLVDLGVAYCAQRRHADAERSIDRAIALDSTQPNACRFKTWLQLSWHGSVDDAVRVLKEAVPKLGTERGFSAGFLQSFPWASHILTRDPWYRATLEATTLGPADLGSVQYHGHKAALFEALGHAARARSSNALPAGADVTHAPVTPAPASHERAWRRACAVTALALLLPASPLAAQAARLGTIRFPVTGAPAAQPSFITGVLYMHSFEYAAALRAFTEAERLDPSFAMAYWGEAMTCTHPVWDQQDLACGRAALAKLGPTPEARAARAATPRERAWLHAVELLYGEGTKPQRDTLYAGAMEQLVAAYPDDQEAKAFYALSLLGLNQGVRDVPTYMRAGAIALDVLRANPDHPGAAHYAIHAFDDPVHAPLGLYAARQYSGIAPGAAHAQHMTTHIFLALGMWDDVVRQNEIASGPDRTRWRAGHYTTWLGYGYLQQGRYAEARNLLDLLERNGSHPGRFANLVSRYVVDAEDWDGARAHSLTLADTAVGEDGYRYPAFTMGFAAAHRGDRETLDRAIAALERGAPDVRPGDVGARVVPVILLRELQALRGVADGANDEAVTRLREATALEDAMPAEFGPPAAVKPSHELFGEVLVQLGRAGEAAHEFERALALAPGRPLALRGLARAAAAAGDSATARRAETRLQAAWHAADRR